jgi:deazaflavin-dependent oxidoreductase (nitroreductase family)
MHTRLRFVDATGPPGHFRRAYAALAATRTARFVSRHLNWKLDPLLLRMTRGRFASTLMFPTALLVTRGARTGAIRSNPVIYFRDGDRIIVVASNAGSPHHPGWYHNLLAHPDVVFAGRAMRAAVVGDDEWSRLWEFAVRVFPAFARYGRDAATFGRTIPLIGLTPPTGNSAFGKESSGPHHP